MSIFTGEFTSNCLNKNVVVRVIFPDMPADLEQIDNEQKTMYLLHGYTGSSGDWIQFTNICYYARLYNFTVVLADAENSMYCNMEYGGDYLKFFGEELPMELSKKVKLPSKTFICGQSMGGLGCVKIGLHYPNRYQGIGCLSGGLGIKRTKKEINNPFNESKDPMTKTLTAAFGLNEDVKKENDLMYLANEAVTNNKQIPLIMYCGSEDFLFEDNNQYDRHLSNIGYTHEYNITKGAHTWDYWDNIMPKLMEKFCRL